MNYIRITKENIDKEHICCAMSGKQSVAKKEWLRQRFDDGLVFYRSEERGKCFIEYIPAENAWVPIEADGYLYIDCLWVSDPRPAGLRGAAAVAYGAGHPAAAAAASHAVNRAVHRPSHRQDM